MSRKPKKKRSVYLHSNMLPYVFVATEDDGEEFYAIVERHDDEGGIRIASLHGRQLGTPSPGEYVEFDGASLHGGLVAHAIVSGTDYIVSANDSSIYRHTCTPNELLVRHSPTARFLQPSSSVIMSFIVPSARERKDVRQHSLLLVRQQADLLTEATTRRAVFCDDDVLATSALLQMLTHYVSGTPVVIRSSFIGTVTFRASAASTQALVEHIPHDLATYIIQGYMLGPSKEPDDGLCPMYVVYDYDNLPMLVVTLGSKNLHSTYSTDHASLKLLTSNVGLSVPMLPMSVSFNGTGTYRTLDHLLHKKCEVTGFDWSTVEDGSYHIAAYVTSIDDACALLDVKGAARRHVRYNISIMDLRPLGAERRTSPFSRRYPRT